MSGFIHTKVWNKIYISEKYPDCGFFFLKESNTKLSIFYFTLLNITIAICKLEGMKRPTVNERSAQHLQNIDSHSVTAAHSVCGTSACHAMALIVLQHCLLWLSALSVPSSTPASQKFLHILIKMRSIFRASLKVSLSDIAILMCMLY